MEERNIFKSKKRGPNLRRMKGKGRKQPSRFLLKLATGVWLCVFVILFLEMKGNGSYRNDSEQNRFLGEIVERADKKRLRKALTSDSQSMKIKPMKHDRPILDRIMEGSAHLVDLDINQAEYHRQGEDESYSGVWGYFCTVDWTLHKNDPAAHPMFRYLVNNSPDCGIREKVNLKEVVNKVKEYDRLNNSKEVHVMKPRGFVLHESRCGSTLVANSLAAMDPSKNRVYSESAPLLVALSSCSLNKTNCRAVQLVRDVVYMMGRTNDSNEENLFYKIQSSGTKFFDIAQEAFPEVPWIFVYRDPVQVMMSHLKQGGKNANCVRQLSVSPSKIQAISKEKGIKTRLTTEQKCALHLSTLCQAAISALQSSPVTGRAVNYNLLPDILIDSIIPDHFGVPLSSADEKRIIEISGTYSKGKKNKRDWKEDSSQKERDASEEVKNAAFLFLSEYFSTLEKLA